jgi:hypothetical protein
VTATLIDDSVVALSFGDLLLDTVDEFGTQIMCHSIEGWGSTAGTGGVTQREGADGGWAPAQNATAKVMVLTGTIRARDGLQRELAEYRLQAAIGLDLVLFTVGERTGAKQLWVRRDSDWSLKHIDESRVDWQVSVVAPDPIKYSAGDEHVQGVRLPVQTGGLTVPFTVPFTVPGISATGDVEIFNAGNYKTWPRFIIYGPVPEPSVINTTTGERFTYRSVLQPGEWIDIDTHPDAHTVYLQGVANRRQLFVGDFWSLRPKSNTIAFRATSPSSDARLDVVWRDAWN